MYDLSSRRILVTGAAGCIGRAVVECLDKQGANLWLVDPNRDALDEVANTLDSRHGASILDVTDFTELEGKLPFHTRNWGTFTDGVLLAGIAKDGTFGSVSREDEQRVMNITYTGTTNTLRVLQPQLFQAPLDDTYKRRGTAVLTSSASTKYGNKGQYAYVAAKSAIEGLVETVARDWGKKSVNVNGIAPGFVTSPMTEGMTEKARKAMLEATPQRRFLDAKEIAHAIAFLLSPGASAINGHILRADGGL